MVVRLVRQPDDGIKIEALRPPRVLRLPIWRADSATLGKYLEENRRLAVVVLPGEADDWNDAIPVQVSAWEADR